MNSPTRISLDQLNSLDAAGFSESLSGVFEHAPWVAEGARGHAPFATVAALHEALMDAVRAAPHDRQLAFVKSHPELADKVAIASGLTAESNSEQGGLGLDRLSEEEFARFGKLNKAYREKFVFPFVICVRRHTRDSVLQNFEHRLGNSAATELAAALTEIGYITRLRLVDKVDGPGAPKTTGRLSTHVLDTYNGRPAAGVAIELYEVGGNARTLIAKAVTNADGRTDKPLIDGVPLRTGTYGFHFDVGNYFAAANVKTSEPAFLSVVPVRFSIAEPEGNYHVPLVVTPWSYSTYRGS